MAKKRQQQQRFDESKSILADELKSSETRSHSTTLDSSPEGIERPDGVEQSVAPSAESSALDESSDPLPPIEEVKIDEPRVDGPAPETEPAPAREEQQAQDEPQLRQRPVLILRPGLLGDDGEEDTLVVVRRK